MHHECWRLVAGIYKLFDKEIGEIRKIGTTTEYTAMIKLLESTYDHKLSPLYKLNTNTRDLSP